MKVYESKCWKCKKTFPNTDKYFTGYWGFGMCRPCWKIELREKRKQNRIDAPKFRKKTKVCYGCKKNKRNTVVNFGVNNSFRDGLNEICKKCRVISDKKRNKLKSIVRAEHIGKAKLCKNCKKMKTISYENFYKRSSYSDGFDPFCKVCRLERMRVHRIVRKIMVKQEFCSLCKKVKPLDLANIDGQYSENIETWWWLCSECHHNFDYDKSLL